MQDETLGRWYLPKMAVWYAAFGIVLIPNRLCVTETGQRNRYMEMIFLARTIAISGL